jgi:tetrahydromethanopterin S-methyltransferase subunit A
MTTYKNKKIWVISDVNDEARNNAKKLAKIAKKKMGHWISDLILNKETNIKEFEDREIIKDIEAEITVIKHLINEIYSQMDDISMKLHHMPKKTIFGKFFS